MTGWMSLFGSFLGKLSVFGFSAREKHSVRAASDSGGLTGLQVSLALLGLIVLALIGMAVYKLVRYRSDEANLRKVIAGQRNIDIVYGNLKTQCYTSKGKFPFAERMGLSADCDYRTFEEASKRLGYDFGEQVYQDMIHLSCSNEPCVVRIEKLVGEDGLNYYFRRYFHRISKTEFVIYVVDVTEEVEKIESLKQVAATDFLSTLLNRRAMSERLLAKCEQLAGAEQTYLVMFDIDDFKLVNDRYGHDVGDQVLVMVANTIQALESGEKTTARWGGEEFLLMLDEPDCHAAAAKVEAVLSTISQTPIEIEGSSKTFYVTVSAGLSQLNRSEEYIKSVKKADVALYRAKEEGKNCLRVNV